jgi:hypothetical protein
VSGPVSSAVPKNPKTEALQKARDKILGIYYFFVKDAYMKSMRPALQEWPSPAIPSAASVAGHGAPSPLSQQPCGDILKDLYAHSHLSWDIYNGNAFFVEQLKRHHPTYQLLFMNEDQERVQPCYCIVADSAAKEAIVVFRGTKNSKDFATDGRINLVSFPDGVPLPVDVISGKPPFAQPAVPSAAATSSQPLFLESSACHGVYETAWCHEGIFKSAQAILDGGLKGWAQMLLKSGFRIRLCGHSLGAGVAVIISLLLRQLPAFQLQPRKLQAFIMSPPACVSESLARSEMCLQVRFVFYIYSARDTTFVFAISETVIARRTFRKNLRGAEVNATVTRGMACSCRGPGCCCCRSRR